MPTFDRPPPDKSAVDSPSVKLVELAAEADFVLGLAEVRPAMRSIRVGGAGDISVEPRVMQMLIALARRRGEAVGRDDLVAACWGGRAVSEDAIQRTVAKARRIGERTGAFAIETIARVGYLLKETAAAGVAHDVGKSVLLAVLPFDNLSGDPGLDAFCDGLADELLQTLAHLTQVRLIGRAASRRFRGPEKDVAKVAEELGVTHVLDGSVRQGGKRLRVGLQLVEARSQTTHLSDVFERETDDFIAFQEQIALSVGRRLHHRFNPVPAGSMNPDVRERLVRAFQAAMTGPTTLAHVQALDDIAAQVPEAALGWAFAAEARASLRRRPQMRQTADRIYEEQRALAERALALDPESPVARIAWADTLPPCGAFTEREACFRSAATLGPLVPPFVTLLLNTGRSGEALAAALRGREHAPLVGPVRLVHQIALAELGLVREWAEMVEADMGRYPPTTQEWAIFTRYAALFGCWDLVDRLTTADQLARHASTESEGSDALRTVEMCRDPSQAKRQAMVERLNAELDETGMVRPWYLGLASIFGDMGLVYDLVGRCDFAPLMRPQRAGSDKDATCAFFLPHTAGLRADPRFMQLCARLGLVKHWLETDRWPGCADLTPYDFRAEAKRCADLPLG